MLAAVPMSAPASCCTTDEVYLVGQEPLVVQAQAPAPAKGQLELEVQVLAAAGKEAAAATPDHATTIAVDIPPAQALATVVVLPPG